MRISTLLSILALLVVSFVPAGAAPPHAGPQLRLHRGTFDARTPDRAATPSGLAAVAPGPYAIIQFRGPIRAADRAALEQTGVALLEYLPDFAYLVRGTPDQLDAAAGLPQIYARSPLALADKLDPALLRAVARGAGSVGPLRVIGWEGERLTLEHDLRAAALDLGRPLDARSLLQIAGLPSVRWIEPVARPRLLNDTAREIMRVNSAWQSRGLYGADQIVGVADSGLDTGEMNTISPDFAGRIVATHVLSPGGDLGDLIGHGTHVAGSVAGAGVQSGANPAQHQYAGSFAGVAPEADLVVQAFEVDAGGEIIGLPDDYYALFAQAYDDGARLHTNSWGDATGLESDPEAQYGGYPNGSRLADQFMWDHQDMAIFFAAGNSGRDGEPGALGFCTGGDGVVDADSLLMPGTAKNVITVGATESLRTTGGFSSIPWLFLSFCFAAEPIVIDTVSDDPTGMAAFSSRGPADDGRIKPDIVAPGTNIVSNQSHYPGAGTLWGPYEGNSHYAYSGGTSMATPLVAGTGVLVRQWLTTRRIANPSAAAVKATLLNTAADIAPGQYGTGPKQEIPAARPNSIAGWGRADLGFLDAPPPFMLWVDDHAAGLATGESVEYTHTAARPLEVLSSAQPLRVMLTWTDPPASLSAAQQLVNDLDLTVIGPGGQEYYGNNVATGDRINNVEGIVIANPPVGQYSVQVRGHNIPIETQPYALAVAGPLNDVGQFTLVKSANPRTTVVPGGLITYTLILSANRPVTQTVTLTDALPLRTSLVSASDGGALVDGIIGWTIPSITSGTPVTRTLVVRVAEDVAANTPIVNTNYRAGNGILLPGVGPPVRLMVEPQTSETQQKIYLPLTVRQ